jgi:hypothetical protein
MPKPTRAETELYISKLKLNINKHVHLNQYREAFELIVQAGKVLEWSDYRNVLKYLEERPK